jgi:hypothetical protein
VLSFRSAAACGRLSVLIGCVIWIYRRREEKLRIETRLGALDQRYIMRVLWPDGREEIETFSDNAVFCLRLMEFDSKLCGQNWISPAGPILTDDAELKHSLPDIVERRSGQSDRRRLTRRDRRLRDAGAAERGRPSRPGTPNDDDS